MKIIHITPSYKPAYIYGGPIFSIAKLCEGLTSTKLNIEVVTTNANGTKELAVQCNTPIFVNGVKVYYFKRVVRDHIQLSPTLLYHLFHVFHQSNIIVHIHSWWNLTSIISCLIAKNRKVPVVLSPRGMLSKYTLTYKNNFVKFLIHKFLGKRLLAYCHFHTTSEAEKKEVLQVCSPRSITVIPNLIYLPCPENLKNTEFKHDTNDSKVFNLLFLSRIDRKKGLDLLLNALSECKFTWQLTIAGSGDTNYINHLKKIASTLRINERIQWKGQIEPDKKYSELSSHQLLVLFSHNENFSNVVLESLAAGTPVAISIHVGLSEYVTDKQFGWVSTLEKKDIIKTLEDAYKNILKREMINKKAPLIIKKDYSKSLISAYTNLYKRLR